MTDRKTASTITDTELDALYNDLDRYEEDLGEMNEAAVDNARYTASVEAERDGAYRERAHLVAWLAALHPAVIAPAPDVDEDGWQILYLRIGGKQASWHIAPRDADLFDHVGHVPINDRRAQWDGHTTEEKYAHIGQHAARLYAEARGRVETPLADTEEPAGPLLPPVLAEAIRQMDDDPHGLKAGMIVQPYCEYGQEKWAFRCWGTDDGCDGLLSLGHTTETSAQSARARHLAEDHKGQTDG